MPLRCIAVALLLILCAALAGWKATAIWQQREWLSLQSQQLATIRQIEAFPPPGWERDAWRNALATPYNVWGNVTYAPRYSGISSRDMRALKSQLDLIVAETTSENSIASVDRVFQLLLNCGQRVAFISTYRDEFREQLLPVPVAIPLK